MHNNSKTIIQNFKKEGIRTLYKNKAITSYFLRGDKINNNIETKLIVNVILKGRYHSEKIIIPHLKKIRKIHKLEQGSYHVKYKNKFTKYIVKIRHQTPHLQILYNY